ncbi:MAG: flippase-like domain-containing protein [Deltaproteobacteria bacterium]|nr:flippase-like domain-containing protein [Deltaproteobacteria bacterium]
MAALVALAYTIHDTGLRTIGHYFRRIGWWWVMVVVLEVAITTLDAIAIRAFMSPEHHKVKLRSTLLAQLAGRAVNAVTPSGNLGEALKISVLTEHVSQSRAVATILLYNVASFSVELGVVAIAAPFMVLLVPMPGALQALMLVTAAVCLVLSLGLYALVRRGMLVSFGRFLRRIRVLSQARYERWEPRLTGVDDKVRLVAGARRRDRWIGIAAVITSRFTSMSLSFMILHAVGESLTLGFVAAYIVGGFGIYMVSSLVPMGLGISEGGNYKLFQALGENPARGVTLVLARRVTLIMYAAIGVVLVTASETVKRARARSTEVVPTTTGDEVAGAGGLIVSLPPTVTSPAADARE